MEINSFYSANNLWVLDTVYPDFKNFENLFDIGSDDYSDGSLTNNGIQRDLTDEQADDLIKEMWSASQKAFDQIGLPIEVVSHYRTWHITYNPGGYQCVHHHMPEESTENSYIFSAVLNFDNVEATNADYNGCLYGFLSEPDGFIHYVTYPSCAGRLVLMDGRVWHGVYPTSHLRRTLICDFEYKVLV